MHKKAFTLVEMMVVMGIIAIITAFGVSAVLGANRSSLVDSEAQELLSRIREVQNRSFAVVRNNAGALPLIWGITMNGSGSTSTGYTLTSYVADASVGAKPVSEETRNFPGSITANVFKGSNQVSFPYYLDFSTPFGKLWVLDVKCGATGSGCTWRKDTTQTGDYKPYPNVSEIQNSDKLYFEITNGKYSRKVWVNANGDSYIE